MITVNTINDEKRISELADKYGLVGYSFMVTCDGETEKAIAAVKAEGDDLYLRLLRADEDDMADMAIRSALAFGDNRGAKTAICEDDSFEKQLRRVGFTEKNGVYVIEICKVVHYCG